jgi:hypothetical protein
MADEPQTIRTINWREIFPFTHLFRTFRIAVHPSKLLLALAALLLIYTGGRVLDQLWLDRHLVQPGDALFPPTNSYRHAGPEGFDQQDASNPRGIFISFFNYEVRSLLPIFYALLSLRWFEAFGGVWAFVVEGPRLLFGSHPLFAILFTAWFLAIWAIFGGAISRIAAVHVARDEKLSIREALRFSISKFLSFLFAPLIPLIILLGIGAALAAAGWVLFHIPLVGPPVAGTFFFVALLGGFVMALVLVGTLGGANLMFPTVAVEGSDSFDAISRSFSYVFARPWRMLLYTLTALVYGAITYLFVRFFIYLVLGLTHFFVSWWLGGDPGKYFPHMWPRPVWAELPYQGGYDSLKWSEDFASGMISLWVYLVISLLGAYAISFYFSASTIIYYLMRREVDATEMNDVYLEESDDDFADPASPAGAAAETSAPTADTAAATGAGGPVLSTSAAGEGGAKVYDTSPAPSAPNAGPVSIADSTNGPTTGPPAA